MKKDVKAILNYKDSCDMYVINSYRKKKEAFSMQINTELSGSANDTFILPTADVTNIDVDWGDGTSDNYTTAGDKTHVYASPGIYTINITGTAAKVVTFYLSIDKNKILKVFSLGDLGWTSGESVFRDCENLTDIFNTNTKWSRNITTFEGFASGCTSLIYFDAANLDTSNVTNFRSFILNCSSLTTLDVSNWNTANVNNFEFFASGASSLTTLDVSNWNTANVNNFNYFARYTNITILDVGNWNTANVQTFIEFVRGCLNLTTLNVSNWDTSKAFNFQAFARSCSAISNIECQNWDISIVVDFQLFLQGVTIPTATYDQILINWDAQRSDWTNLLNSQIHFGNSQYTLGSAAETARANIIANGATNLIDGGGI